MIKTVVKVDGMACEMCESHINDVIRRQFAVKKVNSSRKKGETTIISEAELDGDAVRTAIQETGYDVGEITSEPYKKRGFFGR